MEPAHPTARLSSGVSDRPAQGPQEPSHPRRFRPLARILSRYAAKPWA